MMGLLFRILICIVTVGSFLLFYIDQLNHLTELRLEIPILEKESRLVQEENQRLQYQIDCFESPIHLMDMARRPEFSHLVHPFADEIIFLQKQLPPSSNSLY
jgi:hypothetical protein